MRRRALICSMEAVKHRRDRGNVASALNVAGHTFFQGYKDPKFGALSNLSVGHLTHGGFQYTFPSSEHSFQYGKAMLANSPLSMRTLRENGSNGLTPGEARQFGQMIDMHELAPVWGRLKKAVMFESLYYKMSTHDASRELLIKTNGRIYSCGTWDATWETGKSVEATKMALEIDHPTGNLLGQMLEMLRDGFRDPIPFPAYLFDTWQVAPRLDCRASSTDWYRGFSHYTDKWSSTFLSVHDIRERWRAGALKHMQWRPVPTFLLGGTMTASAVEIEGDKRGAVKSWVS